MIAWAICAVIVIAIAVTYRLVHHPGDRHHPLTAAAVTLPATEQVMPQATTANAPPWNPAAGWAGGAAPDPEPAQLIHEAMQLPRPRVLLPSPTRPGTFTEGGVPWPASGNGHVTAAEPLAPLPPEPKPGTHPAPAQRPDPLYDASAVLAHARAMMPRDQIPAWAGDLLGHHGERRAAVDAAEDSIYTKAMGEALRRLVSAS